MKKIISILLCIASSDRKREVIRKNGYFVLSAIHIKNGRKE
ncbi:hypothetical protein [uncultured Ruminococcus sp.]|nr:hypothetical protein [uncultured Ruminococcus sp.]